MLTDEQIMQVVSLALEEDMPWGDITSESLIPLDVRATALLVAREPGVMAGARVVEVMFADKAKALIADGDRFEAGAVIAEIDGPAREVLSKERTVLNILQHVCGIATSTAEYVAAVAGTNARIVDTRKTLPGLRALEKHAVVCGGGHNHRFSLSDAVLVKDNHLALTDNVTVSLQQMKLALPHTVSIEVEVDRLDQIETVLASGVVDTIMLDNFSLEDLRRGVSLVNGRALVEASGGVNLATVKGIAETGVDLISVGALTHSVRALDLGLDIEIQ